MRWSLGLCGLLCSPPFIPVYPCTSVEPWGATHYSACPVLHHSESGLSVYLCSNERTQGLLVVRLPAPFVPHSASLSPATATRVLSTPVPVTAPPTGLDVCFFFIYLVLDFPAFRFSVSSGCARRRSVSTYAAILSQGPSLIVGSRGSDWSPVESGVGSIAPSRPLPHGQHHSAATSVTPPLLTAKAPPL